MKRKINHITFSFGLACLCVAGALLYIAKPFDVYTYYNAKPANNQIAMSPSDINEKTIKTDKQTAHNYDTLYGDKEIDRNYLTQCNAFVDKCFNIGYRAIVYSTDSYIKNAAATFPNGKISQGIYQFNSEQFATFLSNVLGANQAELQVTFNPEASFESDNIYYLNGILKINIHSALDLIDLANFFGLDAMESGNTYDIPVTFKISRTTNEIIEFKPGYTAVLSN